MRARKVVTRSGMGVRGKFPSFKNGRMLHWESQLERDAMLLLEFSPGVAAFREQPCVLEIANGDQPFRYFPDLLIRFHQDTPGYAEVKPADKLLDHELSTRLERIEAALKADGIPFWILTERVIRQQPRLANLQMLLPFRDTVTSHRETWESPAACPATFGELQRRMGPLRAFRLLASQAFLFDYNTVLSEQTALVESARTDHAKLWF